MSLYGNSNRPISVQQPMLRGYRATTSIYGGVIPVVYGTNRVPGFVLWYGDWKAIAKQQVAYGKGGPSQAYGDQWNYQAALIIGLCQGPVSGIGNVWYANSELTLQSASEPYTVPAGGGSYQVANHPNYVGDSGSARHDDYDVTAHDYGSPEPVTLSGTQYTPMTQVASNPGPGQYALDPATGTYTFSAEDAGKTVTINYTYSVPNSNTNGQPLAIVSLSLFEGFLGQAPWGYLSSNHPAEAIGYSELAYLCNATFALDSSGSLPNLSFEVLGKLIAPGLIGGQDAKLADVISDLLTSTTYGAGIPSQYIGDLAELDSYCTANGIVISPAMTAQRSASDWISSFLQAANGEAVWSEGLLKFRSYGDTTAVGNGATFTPSTQPIYDLDDDDFLYQDGQDPVQIVRPSVTDAYNSISVEYYDRSNSYNVASIQEQDDWSIATYGLRVQPPVQMDFICRQDVAQTVANALLKRSVYVKAQYKFTLGWEYCLLEPMDLVTLTDAALGLNKTPVRIIEIDENQNGDLQITGEEFPWSIAAPTKYPKQGITPFVPQANADPGNVNTPIVVEATNRASNQRGYELWIGVSGGPNFGGCRIWLSTDNQSYRPIGETVGNARTGVLLAALPSGTDPDTTNTLSVDLGESRGELASGTQADADGFHTLCLVDNELLSYETATLQTGYQYNLTYLRRGVLGSSVAAHGSGAPFLRVDDAVFRYQFDPSLIGKTIYLKFTSFNAYGFMEQDLAAVTAYSYTIQGRNTGVVDLSAGTVTAPVSSPSVNVGGSPVVTQSNLPAYATVNVGPGSLPGSGGSVTMHFTVTGAQVGQQVQASVAGSYGSNWGSLTTQWSVDSTNDVKLILTNTSASAVSYGQTTFALRTG